MRRMEMKKEERPVKNSFIKLYEHQAKYYETDQMGIIHHSNYIRWMEEARVDFFEQLGYPYKRMEQEGIISPVTSVKCQYKSRVHFDDVVSIAVTLKKYTGVKMHLGYEMVNKTTGQVCTVGESEHCFMSSDNKIISLKKNHPLIDKVFQEHMDK